MKKALLTMVSVLAMTAPAFAYDRDDVREEQRELRASERAIDKDNASIDKYEDKLERNRAEKARAKREGDTSRQASESLQIGGNKAMIKGKKGERYVDRKLRDKDREDLREARGDYDRDDRRDRMAPSAGAKRGTFWGMDAEYDYPTAMQRPTRETHYYNYNMSDRNSSY